MPGDVNQVLAEYMPTPDELLHRLEGEGVISRQPVTPKQPVSGASNAASQGIVEWFVSWWYS